MLFCFFQKSLALGQGLPGAISRQKTPDFGKRGIVVLFSLIYGRKRAELSKMEMGDRCYQSTHKDTKKGRPMKPKDVYQFQAMVPDFPKPQEGDLQTAKCMGGAALLVGLPNKLPPCRGTRSHAKGPYCTVRRDCSPTRRATSPAGSLHHESTQMAILSSSANRLDQPHKIDRGAPRAACRATRRRHRPYRVHKKQCNSVLLLTLSYSS